MAVYHGYICRKHPELNGRRYDNGRCTRCHCDGSIRNKKAKSATFTRGEKTYGKVCEKHPHLEGLRYSRSYGCVGCLSDNSEIQYRKLKEKRMKNE